MSDIISLSTPKHQKTRNNSYTFEESVTSFGSIQSADDSSSTSSQGTSFKTVLNISGNSSQAGSSIDLTSQFNPYNVGPSPVNLVTFQASPRGKRGNPVLVAQNSGDLPVIARIAETDSSPSITSDANVLSKNESKEPSSTTVINSDGAGDDIDVSFSQGLQNGRMPEEQKEPSELGKKGIVLQWKSNGGLDLESDDTDDTGTPIDSPAKRTPQHNRNPSIDPGILWFILTIFCRY